MLVWQCFYSIKKIFEVNFCLREAQGLEEGSDEGGGGRMKGMGTVLNFFVFHKINAKQM